MKGLKRDGMLLSVVLACLLPLPVMAVDMEFRGELLDRPCQIKPGDENQLVTFMDRPAKDFWFPPARSPAESFSIHLTECDTTSVWKTVKVKFSGTKEEAMGTQSDYFLAMSGGPNKGKLAVGLLDSDGTTPLKLDEAESNIRATAIDGTDVALQFKAFVQATPAAIVAQNVAPGEYTSTVNFELFYQ